METKEKTELLFEATSYDSKNITNKGVQTISQEALNEIETKGVTLEFLEALNAPVFKYRTQITIHGMFPKLENNYLGGYKRLFQNKNLSIGVKWEAVDFLKKQRIYNTISRFIGNEVWYKRHNSQEFNLTKRSKHFDTKEQYKEFLIQAQEEIKHIDKSLFYGNVSIYLVPAFGTYFLMTEINIGAILEKNVVGCIENICKTSIETIEAKFAAVEAENQRQADIRKIELEAAIAEKKAKQAPIFEAARTILISNGYELQEKTAIEVDKVYIKIEVDTQTGCFNFVAYKYMREARQKKFRYIKATGTDLNFEFKDNLYNTSETIQTTQTGWVKKAEKKVIEIKPIVEAKKEAQVIKPTCKAAIEVINYSDKAVAIFGDTRSIKENLKAIGARFNPFLNHNGTKQAGWILPASKQSLLTQFA